VKGEIALIAEAEAERDFCQAELAICAQEVCACFDGALEIANASKSPALGSEQGCYLLSAARC
jgi:hypothetical protein